VFGYYLEITRSNLDRVPSDYVRKQTLANAERFVTSELADYEAKILGADERRIALELEAFDRLRRRVADCARRILPLAELVARLDALAALAEVAHFSGYVRPEVDTSLRLEVEDGRHPVVEKLAAAGRFVPNDTTLDPDDAQLMVITGPNMAGKSTVMRQTALIVVMAQLGSFVPARRARVGIVDRVFTRVGASDNLARGESTFMVEMRETAHILSHATRRSLVVLDEIGRGTSTYDGVSIAWAVAEHLHDRIGCKTMFATHYHELTALAEARPRVRNFSTAVKEWKDEIVFLHKLVEGGASRSYGIQVARLAGLDKSVVARAKQILAKLETGDESAQLPLLAGISRQPAAAPAPDASAERPRASEIERALADADLDGMSPREAHALLAELQSRLKRAR
jgi:DNA mismatch repair protein MutS